MISLQGVSKRFDGHLAVDDVSLEVEAGQTLALLGPSGSGKSTLLSLIAGLETPDAGDIRANGQSLAGVPPHRRGFGLMFQDYLLFPHLDVARNVGFGLRMAGQSAAAMAERVDWALGLVGLPGFGPRDVSTLSGGEQQRVALARALAPRPRLLMLDEPLGALDRALRERLLDELRAILRGLEQTAIYVTHDQEEAFALADQVAILRAGQLVQFGRPNEIYARPANRFVAEFLGLSNLLPARLEPAPGQPGAWQAVTPAGTLPLGMGPASAALGQPVTVLLRPRGATLAPAGQGHLAATVTGCTFRGNRSVLELEAGEHRLRFEFPAAMPLPGEGERVGVHMDPAAVQILEERTMLDDEG